MLLSLEDHVGQPTVPTCCDQKMTYRKVISAGAVKHLRTCLHCGQEFELDEAPTELDEAVKVEGFVTLDLINGYTGKKYNIFTRQKNVFTDVGRNFLSSLISYLTLTQTPGTNEPASSKRRYDGVRYIGVGTGTQLERSSVTQLDTPVPFNAAGDYLAQVVAPNELQGTGISATFIRIFGLNEISVSGTVTVSEVGLFPSGPESSPLPVTTGINPPLAYKTFPGVPVTTDFLFGVQWEIKF